MNTVYRVRAAALSAALVAGFCLACSGAEGEGARESEQSDLSLAYYPSLSCYGTRFKQLAYTIPSGMVASTGNLYWTSNLIDEFGTDSATLWRASKQNTPGAERALYQEQSETATFGSVSWQLVDGQYYGYFVANETQLGATTSHIDRVPLGGGAKAVLATSPAAIRQRDLATNGDFVAWVDQQCVRVMPIRGGTVRAVLCNSAGLTARIALDRYFVYIAQGASIARFGTDGDFYGVVGQAHQPIAAFSVVLSSSGQAFVAAWGETDGSVYQQRLDGGSWAQQLQAPSPGRAATSIQIMGGVSWTECSQPSNGNCVVKTALVGVSPSTVASAASGAGFIQSDGAGYYWGDSQGIHACLF